jgi:outer membrane lipoprotein LolB
MKQPSLAAALLGVAVLVWLPGCATQRPAPTAAPAAARTAIAAFELQGRLAATDGTRAASGSLLWLHGPTKDEWTLLNPLGQIAAQLVSTPGGAQLLTSDGRMQRAESASKMLPELLGVAAAPMNGLPHWVQAATGPGARILSLDALGRPARIADNGWVIEYPEYSGPEPDAPPRRIDAHWGEARIRLIIDQWTPRP